MPKQNMVSGTLLPSDRDDILHKVSEIRSRLGFLVHLTPEEVKSLFKAANGYQPLLEKAYSVVENHSEILPGTFDKEEFRRDVELLHALKPVQEQVAQLSDALNDTMVALSSDVMTASLEIYSSMKLARGSVPGMDVLLSDMGSFFKRPRRRTAEATAA